MDRANTVIAIDGPSGSGKSTVASMLAFRLGYVLVDSGAMYRAVALVSIEKGIDPGDGSALESLAGEVSSEFRFEYEDDESRVFLREREVTREIRSREVALRVSEVSAHPGVRERMVELQIKLVDEENSVVEGRDIGTVVFPDANLKVYLTARETIRAGRRHRELYGEDSPVTSEDVAAVMKERDRIDSSRRASPLRPAKDAVLLDNTDLSPGQVLQRLIEECAKRGIP